VDLGLEERVALITAASRGLGFAVAQALAREGARVALCGRDSAAVEAAERELADRGAEALGLVTNLTDEAACEAMVDEVLARFGRVDVLVCNTGGPPVGAEFTELSLEDWREAWRTVVEPPLRLAHRLVPGMVERRSGSVVFMTSTWVKQPRPGGVLSSATRSALSALSKQLATELAPHGVRVNQVMPGAADTERMRTLIDRHAEARGIVAAEAHAELFADVPVGRPAEAEEIATIVALVASPRASYLTGTAIQVDGGLVRSIL
jgi:3-oxoacyl-[acyl-carrier protein] reductase